MNKALIGFLGVCGTIHLLLIIVPLRTTIKAPISVRSKLLWCAFLTLLPLIGVFYFHFKFRSSLFHGKQYEVSAAEERARSGTLAPRDHDE